MLSQEVRKGLAKKQWMVDEDGDSGIWQLTDLLIKFKGFDKSVAG